MTAAAPPRVTVLYNAPILPSDHPDAIAEADVSGVARKIAAALGEHGFTTTLLAARPPLETMLAALLATGPDLVFNLIEGFWGSGVGATLVTGMLELAGLVCTGCPSESLCWCLSKSRAKALLRGLGLPTAPFMVIAPGAPIPEWPGPWPAFVKPDAEDASLGIDQRSVAVDQAALVAQVERVRGRYGGQVLIEAYLPGPEFNVGLLALPDPAPLPIAEVAYQEAPGTWPILTYESKWFVGSPADLASPIRCPALIEDSLARSLGSLAVAAFGATGCRDYARVDFRLDDRGAPMILEVNPNPDLGPTAGWARALRCSGRDYGATLAAVARAAIARGPTFVAARRHGPGWPPLAAQTVN
jgi:D-alanine-D-alanine ligase